MKRLLRLIVATLTLSGSALGGPPVPASAASDTITLQGHGWGHGRGLGQYGSLGYAVDHGWGYQSILDHFYGGTSLQTLGDHPNLDMTVRLMNQDDRNVLIVRAGSPYQIGTNAFAANTSAKIEVSGGVFTIWRRNDTSCHASDGWSLAQGGISGLPFVEILPPTMNPGEDRSKMLELCRDGNTRHYRGALQLHNTSFGYRTVNRARLDEYVRGVVPRESPSSWGSSGGGRGMEALKAQAVAARSYAWSEGRYDYAKTCDTASCQVYGGAAYNNDPLDHGSAYANSSAAVAATAGQVRAPNGAAALTVARTEFSSSTGGYTARPDTDGNGFPDVPDAGDSTASNPNHLWQTTIGRSAVESRYSSIGRLVGIDVTSRNGRGDWGGRVKQLVLRGTGGSVTLTGDQFRLAFGLKSDWYRFAGGFFDHPITGVATRPGGGFYLVDDHGAVFNVDGAPYRGDVSNLALAKPLVDMAVPRDRDGYWLLGGDGGVFTFGNLQFYGSTGNLRLAAPVVGMAAHPSGQGYWFVASDGGVFTYGPAATFHGSMGGRPLNKPVVGMAAHPSGNGYWLVASDGGIFTFGPAASFYGSTGSITLNQPIVGMAAHPSGNGYWFVASDGGIFAFGPAAGFHGSLGGSPPSSPIVSMASSATGNGYRLVAADGSVYEFGDA